MTLYSHIWKHTRFQTPIATRPGMARGSAICHILTCAPNLSLDFISPYRRLSFGSLNRVSVFALPFGALSATITISGCPSALEARTLERCARHGRDSEESDDSIKTKRWHEWSRPQKRGVLYDGGCSMLLTLAEAHAKRTRSCS